jgi:hypothetical protein
MHKPLSGPVPVLVWLAMNFGAPGLISTRTNNRNGCPQFQPGQSRRAGVKGFVPRGTNGKGNGAHVNGGNFRSSPKPNGRQEGASANREGDELNTRILALEKTVSSRNEAD